MSGSVLITGSSGLIGSELLKQLRTQGIESYALRRQKQQVREGNDSLIDLDLSGDFSTGSFPSSIETVIHLAQSSNFRNFPAKAKDIFNVNVRSTAKLADFAINSKVKRFIYASSGGVYKFNSSLIGDKSNMDSTKNLGFYLATKLMSETLLSQYVNHMQVVILRFFFVYGPGQDRRMLLPRMFDNINNGEIISLDGVDGINVNPIHVSDAAMAIVKSLNLTQSGTFDIAGPQVQSLREIAELFSDYLQKTVVFTRVSSGNSDIIGDISRMSSELISPTRFLRDSIADIGKIEG
jgi:UDP-glucose 4-epimerase